MKAIQILNIPENIPIDEDVIKRYYRMMALKYHPDKNKSDDASIKFQEISSAYEYLKIHFTKEPYVEPIFTTYDNLLHIFINQALNDDFQKQIIYLLISRILNKTTNKLIDMSLNFLEKIDISILKKIHDFLMFYSDIFHSLDFLEKINKIIQKKEKKIGETYPECIILNPLLEDLFENNLYMLKEKEHSILVPLWHHELIYDLSGIELYVECYPILPENIRIDEENNIHIYLEYSLKEIWSLDFLNIKLGNREFIIKRGDLHMLDFQTYIIKNEGISKIDEEDIYNISVKSDLFFYIDIL